MGAVCASQQAVDPGVPGEAESAAAPATEAPAAEAEAPVVASVWEDPREAWLRAKGLGPKPAEEAGADGKEPPAGEEAAKEATKEAAEASPSAAGVWAEGEEEATTKEAEKQKKKEEEKAKKTVKKRKEADATTKVDAAAKAKAKAKAEQESKEAAEAEAAKEAAKEAIREREQAWKKKTGKEKEDLMKQMLKAGKDGNVTEIQNLLDKGVSPNAEDGDGWTALMKAAEAGEKNAVEILLKNGGSAKAALKLGEWGQTPLHFAARHDRREIAELLTASPTANVKAKNHLGKTASEVAKQEGFKDLAKYLRGLEKSAA